MASADRLDPTTGPQPTAADLAELQAMYDRGLFLQAWQCAQARGLPPLAQWRGAAGRLLACRLANRLGASRLGDKLIALGSRSWAAYCCARAIRRARASACSRRWATASTSRVPCTIC